MRNLRYTPIQLAPWNGDHLSADVVGRFEQAATASGLATGSGELLAIEVLRLVSALLCAAADQDAAVKN